MLVPVAHSFPTLKGEPMTLAFWMALMIHLVVLCCKRDWHTPVQSLPVSVLRPGQAVSCSSFCNDWTLNNPAVLGQQVGLKP